MVLTLQNVLDISYIKIEIVQVTGLHFEEILMRHLKKLTYLECISFHLKSLRDLANTLFNKTDLKKNSTINAKNDLN